MNRELPPQPENRILNRISRGLVASVLSVAMLGMIWGQANADELDDQRDKLQSEIDAQKVAVEGASSELTDAVKALETAKGELRTAEEQLAAAEVELQKSAELDAQRAEELKAAEIKAEKAKADVEAAQAAYDSVDRRTNEEITVITQQGGGYEQLSMFLTDLESADLNQRAQLADTLFSSSALELDELTERRFQLDAAKTAADEAEAAAAEARKAAADQLEASKAAEVTAAEQRQVVADKVAQRDEAAKKADAQLNSEKQRQTELETEAADVDRRIQERIAEEKRLAAEKAAQEKAAQEKAAQEEASRNKQSQSSSSSSSSPSSSNSTSSSSSSSSSSAFSRPVSGSLSSPYGMRLHPVLGYWKLHDGTDFAAGCGSPIYAPADGVVSERYFNAGYGNRLMIDHGSINGTYVTTGYNHATSYTVSVGQRVSRGQLIGYVGTTGYSTGCHLHLMVWENGSVTNPMARWFS
ncbi:MAG: peptidoglycan DD-metalloendopeptidase family protein [Propionibacteriaceae bacterium]|nr:peptidoglycan DD-metalloendopeptidase family protein [Propionibacteriaceae bacterium]